MQEVSWRSAHSLKFRFKQCFCCQNQNKAVNWFRLKPDLYSAPLRFLPVRWRPIDVDQTEDAVTTVGCSVLHHAGSSGRLHLIIVMMLKQAAYVTPACREKYPHSKHTVVIPIIHCCLFFLWGTVFTSWIFLSVGVRTGWDFSLRLFWILSHLQLDFWKQIS